MSERRTINLRTPDDVIERYVFDGRVEHRHPIFGECCHENVRSLGADPHEDNSLLDLLSHWPDRRVRVTVEFLVENEASGD